MEIREYWSRAGSAKWALVIVPVTAAVVAGAVAASADETYQATAEVSVVSPSGVATPAVVKQSVEDYRAQLTTDAVRTAASEETGIPRSELRAGQSSAQVGASNIVRVKFETPTRDDAEPGVAALANNAYVYYVAPFVEQAESEVAVAQERVDDARADVAAVSEETGIDNPQQYLREKSAAVNSLTIAIANTATRGLSTKALEAEKAAAEKELAQARVDTLVFEGPLTEQSAAESALARSERGLTEAKSVAAEAADGTNVTVAPASTVNASGDVIRAALTAALAGLVLAALFLVIITSLRRKPAGQQPVDGPDAQLPGPRNGDDSVTVESTTRV